MAQLPISRQRWTPPAARLEGDRLLKARRAQQRVADAALQAQAEAKVVEVQAEKQLAETVDELEKDLKTLIENIPKMLPASGGGRRTIEKVLRRIYDLPNGLGSAAGNDTEDFATAGQGDKADTAVQPARAVTAGTGLTGGGDLSEDREIALSTEALSSLQKADGAVQREATDTTTFSFVDTSVDLSGGNKLARADMTYGLIKRRGLVVDDITAMKALTAAKVYVGGIVNLRFGSAYGGKGPRGFLVQEGSVEDNYGIGAVEIDKVIVENDDGDITFVREDWLENNNCNLRWFDPSDDSTSDSKNAFLAWVAVGKKLAALNGRVRMQVPRRATKYLTSATILLSSGMILTGGGCIEFHSDRTAGTSLIRSESLSAGLNTFAQDYIELRDIELSGGNLTQPTNNRQGLVRIYSTNRFVIGDNVKIHDNQSHLLVSGGNGSLVFGNNVELYNWGHPSNGVVISNAVDNGSGAIRLTVASTATMTTGDLRIVNGVAGVTNANSSRFNVSGAASNGSGAIRLTVNSTSAFATGQTVTVSEVVGTTEANGTWVITVVDGTHVDLQGSTFTNAYTSGGGGVQYWAVTVIDGTHIDLDASTFSGTYSGTSGRVSSGVDGGSAVICLPGTDTTIHGRVQMGAGVWIHDGQWNGMQLNCNGFIINGVVIERTKESGIYSRNIANNTFDGVIVNCIIRNVKRAFIDSAAIEYAYNRGLIAGNLIVNSDAVGISTISEAYDVSILNNEIVNGNLDPSFFPIGSGINLRDATLVTGPNNITIRGNKIRDIQVSRTCVYGIYVDKVSPGLALSNFTIENNDVYQCTATAGNEIFIAASAIPTSGRWFVRNNLGAPRTYQTEGVIAHDSALHSLTGSTTKTQLAKVTIPAGFMKPNSRLEIETLWNSSGAGGTKTAAVEFGGTSCMSISMASGNTVLHNVAMIANRGTAAIQVGTSTSGLVSGTGWGNSSSTALITGNVDTSAAVDVIIYGTLASSGDTMSLQSYKLTLIDADS